MAVIDGGPAFPVAPDDLVGSKGMTLRDWFAGQALNGIADHFDVSKGPDLAKGTQLVIAHLCYDYADAMLAARSKEAS